MPIVINNSVAGAMVINFYTAPGEKQLTEITGALKQMAQDIDDLKAAEQETAAAVQTELQAEKASEAQHETDTQTIAADQQQISDLQEQVSEQGDAISGATQAFKDTTAALSGSASDGDAGNGGTVVGTSPAPVAVTPGDAATATPVAVDTTTPAPAEGVTTITPADGTTPPVVDQIINIPANDALPDAPTGLHKVIADNGDGTFNVVPAAVDPSAS